MHNKQATDQIYQYLSLTRDQAKAAESTYEANGTRLEIRSRYTTSSFDNMSNALHLITEARELTRNYYAALVSAVYSVDELCRPLLAQNPSPAAIQAVAEFCQWCNKESASLGTNFNASVNGISYGDVATTRFTADSRALSIASFWRNSYEATPEAVAEKAAQAKRREEERVRRQKERIAREAQEAAASKKRAAISTRRDTMVKKYDKALKAYDDAWVAAIEAQRPLLEQKHKQAALAAQLTLTELQVELASCKLFDFSRKSELKRQVQAQAKVASYVASPAQLNAWIDQYRVAAQKAHDAYSEALTGQIDRAYKQGDAYYQGRRISNAMLSSTQEEHHIQQLIMKHGPSVCISDIKDADPFFADYTQQRFSAVLRRMVSNGTLERTEINRVAYFSLADSANPANFEYEYTENTNVLAEPMPTGADIAASIAAVKLS